MRESMNTVSPDDLACLNAQLRAMSAPDVVAWAVKTFGDGLALSSSFGIQSAVMLHLVTQVDPKVPVVWVDTGYLPPETYTFAADLTKKFGLNLHIAQSKMSPAHMEAIHGKLWEQPAPDAHRLYGQLRKVEPMERTLSELKTTALLVGLRAEQTAHRQSLDMVHMHKGRLKICPILHWSQADVDEYMRLHGLPYHPLKELGYATVGDAHSSRPVADDDTDIRATRFHGKAQECGLHMDWSTTASSIEDNQEAEAMHERGDVDVVIYSIPTCKYCVMAKQVFERRKWSFKEILVGDQVDYPTLCRLVGTKVETVPQIFLRGEYIGGYTHLVQFLQSID
ncbi:hypothetical protein Ae201684P_003767 [Aphanomyces euteiches]|uniref:Uncharacterized protein n=1 Tax=Aphanomyces euteiches TaxID=100861 RepID=A0A6G0XUC2_9STRA|nr:hypothetical protein Ae201684_001619 [Aphanomyces euteiches]KAH9075082.1 hypothetical protein Ae201684P_003767 [Aphanomyces euteiches]